VKTNSIAQESGWNVSFWFAVSSPLIEEAMSTTPIVFILIILLFGFDSTGQVRTQLALKDRARNLKFSEISIFERLRKK